MLECALGQTVPGRARGRVWLDAQTDDVLRLDEQMTGMFEFPIPAEHLRHGDFAEL